MAKNPTQREKFIWILGLASSLIFGYLSFRNLHWDILLRTALVMDPWYCLLAGVLMTASFSLRAYRWKIFLPTHGGFTYGSRLSGVAIGYFFSNILPGRMGDLLRPGYLARANEQPYQICLYSIITERVWELVLFFLLSILILNFTSIQAFHVLHIDPLLLTLLIASGILLLTFSRQLLRILVETSRKRGFPLLDKMLAPVLAAYKDALCFNQLLLIVFTTVSIFLMEGLFFLCLIRSMHIDMGLVDALVVMIVSSLSIMLPSAPAGVGVFHYFCQTSLVLFGVQPALAVSAAVLIHAFVFLFDMVFALACIVCGPLKPTFSFRFLRDSQPL